MLLVQVCIFISLAVFASKGSSIVFDWLQSLKSVIAMDMLMSEWRQARIIAVSHHLPLLFCGSEDGVNCASSWCKGRLLMTASKHEVIWYHKNNWPQLHWRQGIIMQREGIIIAADGSLASSAGHFSWEKAKHGAQAIVNWKLTVQSSGLMHS